MPRKTDLEKYIRDSYALIREYEEIVQLSGRPEEKARARRIMDQQWSLIEGYWAEYRPLSGGTAPADIAEIAAHCDRDAAPMAAGEPTGGTTYHVHIDHVSGLALGDGARVDQRPTQVNITGDGNVVGDGSSSRVIKGAPETFGSSRGVASRWNTAAIRDMLSAAFGDGDLTNLCFDYYRGVYESFSRGMTKGTKIQLLIEHCVRYNKLDDLVALVHSHNTAQYDHFKDRLSRT